MKLKLAVAALSLVSLNACGSPKATVAAVSANQLVYVPEVVGALKCAFALALEKESAPGQRKRLAGKVADVALSLQIVDTTGMSGEAKFAGPAIIALGAGGSVTPFFNGSFARTNTVQTLIKFRLRLQHEPQYPSACLSTPNNVRTAFGFENWLATVIRGLEPNSGFAPAGELDSIQFKGSFGVEKKGGGGAEFNIVFLSGKVGATAGRNDVQAIDFTIVRPSQTVKVPSSNPGSDGADVMIRMPAMQ